MTNRLLLIYLIAFFLPAIASCQGDVYVNDDEQIIKDILEYRKHKDSVFKYDPMSPVLEQERQSFKGLSYFAPSVDYVVNATFIKNDKPDTIKILTTKPDDIRYMLRIGKFEIELGDKLIYLNAYMNSLEEFEDEVDIFLPFTDKTTGNSTYEVGRYLDITINTKYQDYYIDFNMAYNPYCAYNPRYSCPLVPLENHLQVEIKAGEKTYKY